MTTVASYSKRDALTHLFDAAKPNGVAYLLAIVTLGSMTVKELRAMTRHSEPTVNQTLLELESRKLVQRAASGKADNWFPTPLAALAFHQKLFGEPSSSSSDPDQLALPSDQIRSEEEEVTTQKTLVNQGAAEIETTAEKMLKVYIADKYNLTGEKRVEFLSDAWSTPDRFMGWLYAISRGKTTNGLKVKYPEAYALKCLRQRHEPDSRCLDDATREIDNLIDCVSSLREAFQAESKASDPPADQPES
jgi:DNA-binding transcriptional regulator GbsR (MarR family)